jgi:hypothetical protein
MKPSAIYTSTNVLGASLAYDLVLNRLTNKTPFLYREIFLNIREAPLPLVKLGGYSFIFVGQHPAVNRLFNSFL